jgi:hypothetical protein
MPIEVQGPDGSVVEFPEGTEPGTIHSVMSQHFGGPQPSTAEDVAKSAGIGLAKGAIGIPGLPGDLAAALPHAADYLRGKAVDYGLMSKEAAEKDRAREEAKGMRNIPLPSSADIRGAVEQKTGPFYEPQTRAGRYAQSATEFVPAAVLGGGGVARNALRYGVAPGLAAEAAGEATQGTGLETWARVGAALGVGGIGGLVSQPRTAERFIRAQLPEYVDEAAVNSADSLIRDANARGVRLTWPEALSQVTGQPVLNDTQRILEASKQTRATMQQTLGDRPAEIAQAGENVATGIAPPNAQPSTIGPQAGQAAEGAVNDVREAINQKTKPFYDRAANIRLTPQEMQRVVALPGWDEAVKAVRGDPQLNRYVARLPANSVGFLNEVKKYFDQQATNAARPLAQNPNMQRAAGYSSDAAAAREIGINASPEYATALGAQAHYRETYLEPLLQGPLGKLADKDITTQKAINALFPDKPLAGSAKEVSTTVSALSSKNPEAARQLVRAHVEGKLEEAFNAAGRSPETSQFSGAEFAKRITGNPLIETARAENFRAAVEALPNGKQIWPGIERFLDITRATGWRQPIGSKTAFNEAELHGMATGQVLGNIAKTAASPGEWWHAAHEMWGKWQTGNNLADLAKIITDPRSAGVFKKIVSMDPYSASQAAARVTAVAAGLVGGSTVEKREPLRITVHPTSSKTLNPGR